MGPFAACSLTGWIRESCRSLDFSADKMRSMTLERVDIHFAQIKALTRDSMDKKALDVCS